MAFVHVATLHGKFLPLSFPRGIILPEISELVPSVTSFSSFISAPCPLHVYFRHILNCICFFFRSCSPLYALYDRYLDPDPLLLAAPHGNGNGDEVNSVNPRFHALNQALVQLVSRVFHSAHSESAFPHGSSITSRSADPREKNRSC